MKQYWTSHGIGPGILPKNVTVINVQEGQNNKGTWGDWVETDRELTEEEMNYYDFREVRE